ncbi:MAG TPA: ChaN family lipoprotein [Candidatus Binatia bacterium]|nr:ChaN family lipoprotein [Candidatus Binatia bacterium]
MATTTTLRFRRSAAQLDALVKVEREIRATDRNRRPRYLREFSEAYPSYHSVLGASQLQQALATADILLVGDYHALASCQRFCARLIAGRSADGGRPLALGVEAVFARDQQILDEWLRGEIDEQELRERIRYDLDWQYDWTPFYELLQSARAHAAPVYALDCMPREDMRRISVRDRHAARKIAGIRARHPEAQIVVLFGESHLAPSHLPAELTSVLPRERVLTVLQNLDQLYWKAAGERKAPVEAVPVEENAICVFNATPLEKYESYRLYLERWRCERATPDDLAPVFYNLIDALLRFLGIDKYRAAGRSGEAIVDLLPEIYSRRSEQSFRKLLVCKGAQPREVDCTLEDLCEHGCCYVPALHAILAARLNMRRSAELASQFVLLACQGRLRVAQCARAAANEADLFYSRVLDEALLYLGSRLLYPARPPVREADYYSLYSEPPELVEYCSLYTYREYLEMIDFLLLHKDYELHRDQYGPAPRLIENALHYSGPRFAFVTRELGLMLGTELYDAYISGRLTRRTLRSLFRRPPQPAEAAKLYFGLVQRIASRGGCWWRNSPALPLPALACGSAAP